MDDRAAEAEQVSDVHRVLECDLVNQEELWSASREHVRRAESQLKGAPVTCKGGSAQGRELLLPIG